MKKVKAFFNKTPPKDSVWDLRKNFPFYVLFQNFNVEVVKSPCEADIIFEFVRHGGMSCLDMEDKKIVVVSAENLFMKRIFFNWVERGLRFIYGNKKKYKVMDELDDIIPHWIQKLPISYFFPSYVKFVKGIDKRKNAYVIWCNGYSKNKKIYNYPIFLADFHDKMSQLVKRGKVPDFSKRKFCAFVVSSNSSRERVHFFKELSKYKKIDSYGKVMNNAKIKNEDYWQSNPKLFSNYKFVICFENCFVDDFITEKLPNVMLSGAIPIYRGPESTKKYFDSSSYIDYDNYGSDEKMIEKIIELDNDDEKYREFLKRPWYHNNKLPGMFKEKEKELVKFYEDMFDDIKE